MFKSAANLARDPAFQALAVLLDPWLANYEDMAAEKLASLQPIDWEALLALARRHRVSPLVSTRLETLTKRAPAVLSCDPEVARSLRAEAQGALVGEMAMLGELRRIKAMFDEIGIRFLLFKGLSLSERCFGRLGQRINRDIDILIDREDMAAVHARLADIGYERIDPPADASQQELERNLIHGKDWTYVSRTRGTILELHHRLFDNAALCDPGVLSRAETIRLFAQIDMPTMSIADELPYLALHGAMHAWSRLKWLVDFAYRLRSQSAETIGAVMAGAQRGPAANALHQAISVCWHVFCPNMDVPCRGRRQLSTRLLHAVALRAMAGNGARELEETRFGTTLKNVSHYLLWANAAYLKAELIFDLNDMSAEDAAMAKNGPIWLQRPLAWMARRI